MVVSAIHEASLSELADEALAARAGRDFEAFAELYNRYLCRIYRFVRSQAPDDSTAEDLTAQTFFKALSNARSFRGNGSYKSWIFKIARNTVVTWRARRAKAPLVVEEMPEPVDPAPTPAAAVLTGEEGRLIRHLVSGLPPAQREVLSLRYLEDLSTEEVASITGRSRGAIRILLHRARASLRSELGERGFA
ncbi:MAG: RNA polymerase sigma factor [Actinomycetota bacterium]